MFGYGTQAYRGRYFAIHEAKVVLARILAKYDFKLTKDSASPMAHEVGIPTQADAGVELLFKRRAGFKG